MSLYSSNFPCHWKTIPIDEVVFFQEGPGVRKYQYMNSGVKLLNGGNINEGILNLDTTVRYISEEEAYEKYNHFLVDEGDLLIACSGVVVEKFDGKIAYAKKEHLPLCMNTSTMRFKSLDSDVLHIDYFRRFLASNHFKNQLQKLITGSAQLNFGPSHIKQMAIPLPPLTEQKRIAAILDKADSLRRKNQQAIQLSDQFLRSVFMDLFGDPVTNPKGWEVKPICNIAIVKTGNTPSRAEPEYYGDYIEWIKSDNINTPQHILTTASEYLSKEGYEVGRKVSEGATLITCIAGSFNCIGNIAFADREVCFNQQINALIPMTVKPWFLYALILYSKKKIQAASTNAMKGMVSKGVLEKIEVICPPEDLQIEFEKIFENQRKIMFQTEKSRQLADNAFFALSQKAFAGKL